MFSPDGDYVTDFRCKTIEEVWKKINYTGSRWFFYPFAAVIKDNGITTQRQRIIDTNDFPHCGWIGLTIKQVIKDLNVNGDMYATEMCR